MKEIIQLQLQLQLQLYYVFFLKKLHLQFLRAAGSIANLGGKLFLPAAQEADLLEDEPWDEQRRKTSLLHHAIIMNNKIAEASKSWTQKTNLVERRLYMKRK